MLAPVAPPGPRRGPDADDDEPPRRLLGRGLDRGRAAHPVGRQPARHAPGRWLDGGRCRLGRRHRAGRLPPDLGPRRRGRAERGTATFVDGAELPFEVVGRDPLSDLAVIRTTGGSPPPAPLGDAARLKVGQLVVAIGNPLGFAGHGHGRRRLRARAVARRCATAGRAASSRTSSRPTRRSTPATPAAHWRTRGVASSASTPRSPGSASAWRCPIDAATRPSSRRSSSTAASVARSSASSAGPARSPNRSRNGSAGRAASRSSSCSSRSPAAVGRPARRRHRPRARRSSHRRRRRPPAPARWRPHRPLRRPPRRSRRRGPVRLDQPGRTRRVALGGSDR